MSTTAQSEFGNLPKFSGNSVSSGVQVQKVNVTQLTSITTGVTANASAGVITTVSAATAAGGAETFVLTNSKIFADSVVLAQVVDYAGTFGTGLPVACVDTVADGSCDIVLMNPDGAALDNVVKVAFQVL